MVIIMAVAAAQSKIVSENLWDLRTRTFSTDMLKLTAMATMLIDHIGAGILEYLIRNVDMTIGTRSILLYIDQALRLIGRIAFPLFCFLLVQGFLHTRSRLKYAGNLFLFALISEFPFHFMLSEPVDFSYLNVYFTLFIGLITLWGVEKSGSKVIWKILATAAGMMIAGMLHTDYSWRGILLILSLYFFRKKPFLQCTISCCLFFLAHVLHTLNAYESFYQALTYQFSSKYTLILAFWMMYRCNGKRYMNKGKYFFYAFYPVHLILLGLVLRLLLLLL